VTRSSRRINGWPLQDQIDTTGVAWSYAFCGCAPGSAEVIGYVIGRCGDCRQLGASWRVKLTPDTQIVMVYSTLGGIQPTFTRRQQRPLDALSELCGMQRILASRRSSSEANAIAYYYSCSGRM
jgi:hypothetical protein